MADLDSLLFQVFERLRRQGVPLGVSDYLLAIETIQAGVGLEDSASFKGLCRLLWAKSREDQELFDLAFAELVEPPSTAPPQPSVNQPEPQPQPEPEPEEELEPQQVRVTLPSRSVGHSFELKTELTEKPLHKTYSNLLTTRLF